MKDLIYRQDAIDAIHNADTQIYEGEVAVGRRNYMTKEECCEIIDSLPSAQPTLHGYNIEHLELIAMVLQKEDLPPERVVEALTDIGRIVAIVRDEFEETLRRAVQNIERRTDE